VDKFAYIPSSLLKLTLEFRFHLLRLFIVTFQGHHNVIIVINFIFIIVYIDVELNAFF
jgi:hypothetical protein